jgi:hypothetical protein
MKPDARWQDVSGRDLTRAIDAAETIFVCVPTIPARRESRA